MEETQTIVINISSDRVLSYDSCREAGKEYIPQKARKECGRKVCVYSTSGKLIKKYRCATTAAYREKISASSIIACVNGYSLECKKTGRIYLYEGDSIKKRIKLLQKKFPYYPYKNKKKINNNEQSK